MSEGSVRPLIWYCAPHNSQTVGNEEDLALFTKSGELSIICSRYGDRLRLPESVALGLSASCPRDTLLLCGDQFLDTLCVVTWFMYHKELAVIVHENYHYSTYLIDKDSMMRLVQRVRDRAI